MRNADCVPTKSRCLRNSLILYGGRKNILSPKKASINAPPSCLKKLDAMLSKKTVRLFSDVDFIRKTFNSLKTEISSKKWNEPREFTNSHEPHQKP
jgi:hypothetical protein